MAPMSDVPDKPRSPPANGAAEAPQKPFETLPGATTGGPADGGPPDPADGERRRQKFLEELCGTGNVLAACEHEAVKVPRLTIYRWRQAMPDFDAEWLAAMDLAAEALESEAFRRALAGTETVTTRTGTTRTVRRRSSDGLLLTLLKVHRPETYGLGPGRRRAVRNPAPNAASVIGDND